MEEKNIEQLKYPIGHFTCPESISQEMVTDWINQLEMLPSRLTDLVQPLTESQLETPYRPGGWTVRQVVHHISDSHHNSYTRFKWALTEDKPVIKAYDEKGWANIFDTRTAPIQMSLDHLTAVHAKLVHLLRGLSKEDLQRIFIHPDGQVETSLEENIGRYAWHGNHHYKHIEHLIEREGWGEQ
ncbi:MAG: YfiT family bacillithiol transferase [Flavobacteriaceae bacterium]